MDQLDEILREATRCIAQEYFNLSVAGGPPVWRERVYCYELYHQTRVLWPEGCQYSLTGEVDKRAHPILKWLEARQAIPDLLIHTPGIMAGNHAVIEVKSHLATRRGIEKDVETLLQFREKVGYERAIYLIYGPDLPLQQEDLPGGIELWWHRTAGDPMDRIA